MAKLQRRIGIFLKDDGISGRSNIVVDEKGIIRLFKNYPLGKLPEHRRNKGFSGQNAQNQINRKIVRAKVEIGNGQEILNSPRRNA